MIKVLITVCTLFMSTFKNLISQLGFEKFCLVICHSHNRKQMTRIKFFKFLLGVGRYIRIPGHKGFIFMLSYPKSILSPTHLRYHSLLTLLTSQCNGVVLSGGLLSRSHLYFYPARVWKPGEVHLKSFSAHAAENETCTNLQPSLSPYTVSNLFKKSIFHLTISGFNRWQQIVQKYFLSYTLGILNFCRNIICSFGFLFSEKKIRIYFLCLNLFSTSSFYSFFLY